MSPKGLLVHFDTRTASAGAERMKQCNALQLEQFLDDLGLVDEEEEEDGDMVNN